MTKQNDPHYFGQIQAKTRPQGDEFRANSKEWLIGTPGRIPSIPHRPKPSADVYVNGQERKSGRYIYMGAVRETGKHPYRGVATRFLKTSGARIGACSPEKLNIAPNADNMFFRIRQARCFLCLKGRPGYPGRPAIVR